MTSVLIASLMAAIKLLVWLLSLGFALGIVIFLVKILFLNMTKWSYSGNWTRPSGNSAPGNSDKDK